LFHNDVGLLGTMADLKAKTIIQGDNLFTEFKGDLFSLITVKNSLLILLNMAITSLRISAGNLEQNTSFFSKIFSLFFETSTIQFLLERELGIKMKIVFLQKNLAN
jgi:hypothetical protein